MKQQHTLQPKLRFPEFDGDWSLKKIKDIAPLQRGFDLPSTELIYGEYPVVYSNGIQNYHNSFKVDGPGIITGRSGTIGKIHYVEGKYWPHNTSLWVTDFKGNQPKFIYYFFLKLDFTKYNAGSTVPTLNRNDVHDLKKIIPSLPEQQKIAGYLSTIDKKINLLEEKKEQLVLYKKAMMQKLFSQEIRFKPTQCHTEPVEVEPVEVELMETYPEWEEKRLKEISEFRRGSFPQPYGLAKWYDDENGYPFVQVYDVDDNFKLKQNTKRKISSLATKSSVFVKKGTLLITIQGSIGRIAITEFDCYVDRTLLIITSLDIKLHIDYYKYCLFLLFEIEKHKAPGGTIKTITKEVLSDFVIPFPCLPEQQKIADFLSAIDESIEKVNEQISQTQSFKKAMLQQMFV
ncbi:restriction endonuclease subunit S [Paenimyroides viscosum]|uniref:Restriction endonuclease subunit S n=1 Tax=Paenimyroides viscosum TaxID=2488729 RepID=A0A3P1B5W8_9FLAO|nr:restriction endonuclease subunit S [Paenimyroides viscosum]RRA96516.1 restriction endonuclease subunit S [Paenimyroides viscosum]